MPINRGPRLSYHHQFSTRRDSYITYLLDQCVPRASRKYRRSGFVARARWTFGACNTERVDVRLLSSGCGDASRSSLDELRANKYYRADSTWQIFPHHLPALQGLLLVEMTTLPAKSLTQPYTYLIMPTT